MVRLAKSLPRTVPKKPTPPPPMKVEIDRTEELALLSTIAERLVEKEPEKETEPPEQVEVINQPDIQKVEVLNFPPPMECKHEMPEMPTEIKVSNLPGTQPVSVENLPLPNGAATQEEQIAIVETLEQIKETVDKLKFNRDGELKTTGSGGYGAGGVRSSLLPADAATATNQVAGNASLASIDAKLTNPLPVSAASLPLPTGAATAANQATEIASLASIDAGIPAALGQTTMAASMPVAIASNQSAIPVSATDLDIRNLVFATDKVDVSGSSITSNPTDYIIQYDDAGSGITYVGKAAAGTSTGAAAWQIFRLDESSTPDFTKLYADGVTTFTKTWTARAGYSYS